MNISKVSLFICWVNTLELELSGHVHDMGKYSYLVPIALFPGVEEGEEKERLVHTVCTCV